MATSSAASCLGSSRSYWPAAYLAKKLCSTDWQTSDSSNRWRSCWLPSRRLTADLMTLPYLRTSSSAATESPVRTLRMKDMNVLSSFIGSLPARVLQVAEWGSLGTTRFEKVPQSGNSCPSSSRGGNRIGEREV